MNILSDHFAKRVLSDFADIARRKLLSAKARLIANDSTNWRKCKPDHPPCAICKEIIPGIPLRLFEGDLEIAFHPACAINRYDDCTTAPQINDVSCWWCKDVGTCPHVSDTVKYDAIMHNAPERDSDHDWEDSF
jgi:hypothetical protein